MSKRNPKRIDEVFAFVACDRRGDEGIMAFQVIPGNWLPMVAGDAERVRSLVPIADQLAEQAKVSYEIRRFRRGRDVTADFRKAKK